MSSAIVFFIDLVTTGTGYTVGSPHVVDDSGVDVGSVEGWGLTIQTV
ncbi:hypothetical protein [Gloeocapsa sp. PCC 73106]|nr:hypothetical protein [Gloeocapsa sp. PCC 73106]